LAADRSRPTLKQSGPKNSGPEIDSGMIILCVFTGHDAGAALFDEYRMTAAVALERLSRVKGDGGRFPDEAIDECLNAAGLLRRDVDALCLPRGSFSARYVTGKPNPGACMASGGGAYGRPNSND
jgi:hypothetical protein